MANSCNIFENIWFSCYQKLRSSQDNETVFCKLLRSPGIVSEESIPPGWVSIPGLLIRFTNTGSGLYRYASGRLLINIERNTSLYLQPCTDRGERRQKFLLENLVAHAIRCSVNIFFQFFGRNRTLTILRACNTRFVPIVFNLAKIFEFRVG